MGSTNTTELLQIRGTKSVPWDASCSGPLVAHQSQTMSSTELAAVAVKMKALDAENTALKTQLSECESKLADTLAEFEALKRETAEKEAKHAVTSTATSCPVFGLT